MSINEILLTVMISGFGLNFALLLIVWRSLNTRIDGVEKRIENLETRVLDMDRRLCRIEGMLWRHEIDTDHFAGGGK